MSTLFSSMKPILLTRFVEQLGTSEFIAGLIVALPFVGIALASLCMRGRLLTARYLIIACVFGVCLIITEVLSAVMFEHLVVIGLLQFFSGICVGILMGTTARYIAVSDTPSQLFGFVDMTAVLLMSFMVYLIGQNVASAGLAGGYFTAAAICVGFFLLLFTFKPPMNNNTSANSSAADKGCNTSRNDSKNDSTKDGLDLSLRPLAVVSMGVLFITFSGLGFAFMFTLAANLGMNYEDAGSSIGILLFVSAFACQAGGWASARFGPERPLACAFVTCAIGWAVAVHTTDSTVFMVALVPAIFSLQFNFPILLSFCGSLDTQGKWAAVASPLITSGFAWAAILAGMIVGQFGLNAIAPATGAGMLVCLGLLGIARYWKPATSND